MPPIASRLVKNAEAERMRSFYDRRHPLYDQKIVHWQFLNDTYVGGREWFEKNLFKYFKEGPQENVERVNRAYRFNHTREVVDLVQKYLFKAIITRNLDKAPEFLKTFWAKSTRSGVSIDQLMRQVSVMNSIFGRVALVVDNNFKPAVDEEGNVLPTSIADVEKSGARCYAYIVTAPDILDYAFDEDGDGELLWIKLREWIRDDHDPIDSSGMVQECVRLWTRTGWELYNVVDIRATRTTPGGKTAQFEDSGYHGLGFVPVRLVDHTISNDPYHCAGLIDDIAYLDRAVANYLSNLDAIIQDQTFSQLAIPAQSVQQGDDAYTKVLDMGTKRIFTYDAGLGSGSEPHYLSPDPKQAGVILAVIDKIINEIYHTVGLAGERTKADNSQGIDNSSGVAKAYDFERVNALLLSKAQSCDNTENWVASTVAAWNGVREFTEKLVSYPVTFDVMRLADDLMTAESLQKIEAPMELRRHQLTVMVDKMFPQLKADIKTKIIDDISTWVVAQKNAMPAAGDKLPSAPSRQGQVTKDT